MYGEDKGYVQRPADQFCRVSAWKGRMSVYEINFLPSMQRTNERLKPSEQKVSGSWQARVAGNTWVLNKLRRRL